MLRHKYRCDTVVHTDPDGKRYRDESYEYVRTPHAIVSPARVPRSFYSQSGLRRDDTIPVAARDVGIDVCVFKT